MAITSVHSDDGTSDLEHGPYKHCCSKTDGDKLCVHWAKSKAPCKKDYKRSCPAKVAFAIKNQYKCAN